MNRLFSSLQTLALVALAWMVSLEADAQLLISTGGTVTGCDDALTDAICERATRSENGARMLESVIDGELLPPLSRALLARMANREAVTRVLLGIDREQGTFTAEVG